MKIRFFFVLAVNLLFIFLYFFIEHYEFKNRYYLVHPRSQINSQACKPVTLEFNAEFMLEPWELEYKLVHAKFINADKDQDTIQSFLKVFIEKNYSLFKYFNYLYAEKYQGTRLRGCLKSSYIANSKQQLDKKIFFMFLDSDSIELYLGKWQELVDSGSVTLSRTMKIATSELKIFARELYIDGEISNLKGAEFPVSDGSIALVAIPAVPFERSELLSLYDLKSKFADDLLWVGQVESENYRFRIRRNEFSFTEMEFELRNNYWFYSAYGNNKKQIKQTSYVPFLIYTSCRYLDYLKNARLYQQCLKEKYKLGDFSLVFRKSGNTFILVDSIYDFIDSSK